MPINTHTFIHSVYELNLIALTSIFVLIIFLRRVDSELQNWIFVF